MSVKLTDEKVERKSQVQKELDDFKEEIAILERDFEGLKKRLVPVLRSDVKEDSSKLEETYGPIVPLAREIQGGTCRIISLRIDMNTVIDLLEL